MLTSGLHVKHVSMCTFVKRFDLRSDTVCLSRTCLLFTKAINPRRLLLDISQLSLCSLSVSGVFKGGKEKR